MFLFSSPPQCGGLPSSDVPTEEIDQGVLIAAIVVPVAVAVGAVILIFAVPSLRAKVFPFANRVISPAISRLQTTRSHSTLGRRTGERA